MGRTLTFNIFRYNPEDPSSKPRMQEMQLEEFPGLNLYLALYKLREERDPTLQFDFVCRAGICGSCGMLINGRPALACRTLTTRLPSYITLQPLPVFKLIGDLSVDTGVWFRRMSERAGSWVHTEKPFGTDSPDVYIEELVKAGTDIKKLEQLRAAHNAPEERMSNEEALEIYELERCIECGCCIAGCGTANMREDFIGAAGLNRVARFMVDPRDERKDEDFFEVIGTDEGAFGCMGLMACDDFCPKKIPLQAQLARVRRAMARAAFSSPRVA